MDPEETKRIIRALAPLVAIFPNWNPKPAALDVYKAVLVDMDPEMLDAAILHLVTEPREFMPTPGYIRDAALELEDMAASIPSAYEGWEEVQRKFNSLSSEQNGTHPFVEAAIKRIGGWKRVGQSTAAASERARFIDAYRELRAEDRKQRRMLPQVREHIALLAKHRGELPAPKDDLAQLATQQKPNAEEMEKA